MRVRSIFPVWSVNEAVNSRVPALALWTRPTSNMDVVGALGTAPEWPRVHAILGGGSERLAQSDEYPR